VAQTLVCVSQVAQTLVCVSDERYPSLFQHLFGVRQAALEPCRLAATIPFTRNAAPGAAAAVCDRLPCLNTSGPLRRPGFSVSICRIIEIAMGGVWRNGWRFVRAAPPLLIVSPGFESQLAPAFNSGRYSLGVIEHFWCAPTPARSGRMRSSGARPPQHRKPVGALARARVTWH